ncbi:MAG: DUF4062 domain-containing protein [Sedimentisphaerales bacterium]
MIKNKKIIFISSRQTELQDERNLLRQFINENDDILPKIFVAKTFEADLAGRKESVSEISKDWVLKSDVYLGIFDREYSEPTVEEYYHAVRDRLVTKEIIIFIRNRDSSERQDKLNDFLAKIMDPNEGHSCIPYSDQADLLIKVKNVLMAYYDRSIESFILSEKTLGPKLNGARGTHFPESMRRKLLEPIGRYLVPRGRKGFPEYYKFDVNGDKIDITWDFIIHEPKASKEIKEFYRQRYNKLYD